MKNILLLYSEDEKDRLFSSHIANLTELTLRCVTSPEECVDILLTDTVATLFVELKGRESFTKLEQALQEKVGLYSDRVAANTIHFLCAHSLDEVAYLTESPLFGHFVVKQYEHMEEAAEMYARVVRSTLKERSFGLSQFLKPQTKIQVIQLKVSTHKISAVDAVKAFLIAGKFQTRMASLIANAADELLMNAMFDAPTDELGKPTYTLTPRSTPIPLEGRHSVEMHIGFDGQFVGISAIDLFGSLDRGKLLAHISRAYITEAYKVRNTSAGAGLGLATVFKSGGSFFFMSESRAKTEVMVFFRKTDTFKDFKNQFRFISTQFYF